MGILDRFKKEEKGKKKEKKQQKETSTKTKKVEKSKARKDSGAYRVLSYPLVSEKATYLGEENKYVFIVSNNATKEDIKRAIKDVYGIKPLKVRTINVSGKNRRYGRVTGSTTDYKKAIITLPEGETIQIYDGV